MLTKTEIGRMRQAALFYRSEECWWRHEDGQIFEQTDCQTCAHRRDWGCEYGKVILLTDRIAELEAIVETLAAVDIVPPKKGEWARVDVPVSLVVRARKATS